MNGKQEPDPDLRITRREEQGKSLEEKEPDLRTLATQKNREEFFKQIIPLLSPLKDYIKRRLRIAYLTLEIRTPVYTSGDILDDVVLRAYDNFERKPENLSLEEWLYRLANDALEKYLHKRHSIEGRRRSFETLEQEERRTLEEDPITGDADGEIWLPEELDDSEYPAREFTAPADTDDPEKQLERTEQMQLALQALSRVPEQERAVFELMVLQGFSKEEVARIYNIRPDEVQRVVDRVRAQVRSEMKEALEGGEGTDRKTS